MPRKASEKPPRAKKSAKPDVPTKVVGTFRLPPSPTVAPRAAAAEVVIDVATVKCPACGGDMWDNRENKRNPRAPDFKCRRRVCEGVIWPRPNVRYVEAQRELAPAMDDAPLEPPPDATVSVLPPKPIVEPERPLVWREDSVREAIDTSRPGVYWSHLVSTDGTVAYALATQVDRAKNQRIVHWGVSWLYPHRAFNQIHQGEESGTYCRYCQSSTCEGARYARKTLAHGPQLWQ